MGWVEVPQAPRGVGGREGYPSPHWGRVWEGLCPLPRNFFVFLLKIPHFDAFWHVYLLNHTPMGRVLTP